jgi:hypothetical protein
MIHWFIFAMLLKTGKRDSHQIDGIKADIETVPLLVIVLLRRWWHGSGTSVCSHAHAHKIQ